MSKISIKNVELILSKKDLIWSYLDIINTYSLYLVT